VSHVGQDRHGDYGQRVQVALVVKDLDSGNVELFGYGENNNDIEKLLFDAQEKLLELMLLDDGDDETRPT